jgi:hypothetical protein
MWETHPDFSETLVESWRRDGEATSMLEVQAKLSGIGPHLAVSVMSFGD